MEITKIYGETHGEERAFYGICDAELSACRFEGEEDGESALKECRRVKVSDSDFLLRYPFWHDSGLVLRGCRMAVSCRAPLWYSEAVRISDCIIDGVKALRECKDVEIDGSRIASAEFGWKCDGITASNTYIEGEYAFLDSKNITLEGVTLKGKYSFQYLENATVRNCVLNTKDAFWHSKNVTVIDCEVNGEYLGWYSEGLRLINCHILGTQPLCYARSLTLDSCTMTGADLAFEMSDVNAVILGDMESIKNPLSGKITVTGKADIVLDRPTEAEITVGN